MAPACSRNAGRFSPSEVLPTLLGSRREKDASTGVFNSAVNPQERPPSATGDAKSEGCSSSDGTSIRRSCTPNAAQYRSNEDGEAFPITQLNSSGRSSSCLSLSNRQWSGGTGSDRIAAFFDSCGKLSQRSPKNWALAASQLQLHHSSQGTEEEHHGRPSQVQQNKRAKATLEMDQRIKEVRMREMRVQHERCISKDPQYQWHLQLLLHPLTGCDEDMVRDLARELESEMMTIQETNERERTKNLKTLANLVRMGSVTLRPTRYSSRRESGRTAHADMMVHEQGATACAPLSNEQREKLLEVFHICAHHQEGTRTKDVMQRSSWFHFLNLSGLLGPQGGVSFCQGAAVFAMFSEVPPGDTSMPSVLTLGSWSSAVHKILRGPNFFRTEREYMSNLFEVILPRVERRNFAEQLSQRRQRLAHLGWQGHLAEEQMCEPEVLLLLHEFERPLRHLFSLYASPIASASSSGDSSSSNEDEGLEGVDAMREVTKEGAGRAEQPRTSGGDRRIRMSAERFEDMLRDLGFFPQIVQQHSAKLHIQASQDQCGKVRQTLIASAGRRRRTLYTRTDLSGGAIALSYASFLLCICRICFVYLSVYGNSIQQASSSKRKCLWMLTFLRVRTSGSSSQCAIGEDIWKSRCTCNLDVMPLKGLVLKRLFHEN